MKFTLSVSVALLLHAVPLALGVGLLDEKVVCKVYPDPHFRTWDGVYYDYHQGCYLVMVKNPGFSPNGLDLHIQTADMGGYSGITNAAIRIGDDVLEIMHNDTNNTYFLTNGGDVTLTEAQTPPEDGGVIGTVGGHNVSVNMNGKWAPKYDLLLPNDQKIFISTVHNESLRIKITANGEDFSESNGLCGSWGTTGFMDRTNTTDFYPNVTDFQGHNMTEFGSHWMVDVDIDPQLFNDPPPPFPVCGGPSANFSTREGLDEAEVAQLQRMAERSCSHVKSRKERRNCEFDVATTGDSVFSGNPDYNTGGGGGAGGDPHIHTFQDEYYSYHGICDLVLVHSTLFGDGLGLDIHIRTMEREGYSSIANAAIRIGHDLFEVVNDGTHFINGVLNAVLPTNLANAYRITKTEAETDSIHPDPFHGLTGSGLSGSTLFEVDLGDEENKIQVQLWKDYLWVNVLGEAINFHDAVGLMGKWGEPGKIARDGVTNLVDPTQYGEEWQVLSSEPKLFQMSRAPQHPASCLPAPQAVVSRRLGEQSQANAACSHVEGPKRDFCVFDVMVTGDIDIAQAYRN